MRFFAYLLLWMLSKLYAIVVCLRNKSYDWGIFSTKSAPFPVICIGNLSVGGTAKTPLAIYCARLLIDQVPKGSLWLLSRGYRRKTQGFIKLHANHSPEEVGDEPYLIASQCKDLQVAVGANRVSALRCILKHRPSPQLLLMDDGFQHRSLQPSTSLLLSTYERPLFRDKLLPLGRLREPISSLRRADGLLFTKCPIDLCEEKKEKLREAVRPYVADNFRVFFSSIHYSSPVAFGDRSQSHQKILLLTGIANPNSLLSYLKERYHIIKAIHLRDHYRYSPKRLEILLSKTKNEEISIFTTEKDYVKIAECIRDAPDLKKLA